VLFAVFTYLDEGPADHNTTAYKYGIKVPEKNTNYNVEPSQGMAIVIKMFRLRDFRDLKGIEVHWTASQIRLSSM
jgi:hypothetical protein